jgi:hypothetical protein
MDMMPGTVTAQECENIFNRFVFHGEWASRERVEEAARALQKSLTGEDCRRINDALLSQLAAAREARGAATPKKALLDDPYVSTLVNTLLLVNDAWLRTVIGQNIRRHPRLQRSSVEELYSAAVAGPASSNGSVSGVMNAILTYDYRRYGVRAFTQYLASAISNALQPTPKQRMTYRRVYARMVPMQGRDEDRTGRQWVDRLAKRPETALINRELLEVLQDVIAYLPKEQQRVTANLVIAHILATGEMPTAREIAAAQQPQVSRERGRVLFMETVNGIRRLIEERYPQLAEQGVNGWEEFRRAFDRRSPAPAR